MFLPKTISILGVTGSIGRSTQDVILSAPECFTVDVVTAQSRAEALAGSAKALKARVAIIADDNAYQDLKAHLQGTGIEARAGQAALNHAVSTKTDICVSAITGMAGLLPLVNAIPQCRAIAIANKEPLVAAGRLVKALAQKHDCQILPIDSEHNAVFQVFDAKRPGAISRIILTASGGPFRTWSREQMAAATPAQALAHPTWTMGRKISIDSATMMNKALEIIEAHILFDLPPEKIEVLVHPQSVVHAMVEYIDGSVLAQLGASDMRTPIAHALAWPERMATPGHKLDLAAMRRLEFEAPDMARFPALACGYDVLRAGGAAPLALNAGNEVAVQAFLDGNTDFLGIQRTIDYALERAAEGEPGTFEDVLAADSVARARAREYLDQQANPKVVSR